MGARKSTEDAMAQLECLVVKFVVQLLMLACTLKQETGVGEEQTEILCIYIYIYMCVYVYTRSEIDLGAYVYTDIEIGYHLRRVVLLGG